MTDSTTPARSPSNARHARYSRVAPRYTFTTVFIPTHLSHNERSALVAHDHTDHERQTGEEGRPPDEGVRGLRAALRVAEEVGQVVGGGAVLFGEVPAGEVSERGGRRRPPHRDGRVSSRTK